MIKFKKLLEVSYSQKYDCRCFYRTSKTNKAAKRSSRRRMKIFLDKYLPTKE